MGIRGTRCTKLEAKDNRVFNTAAFHVSCDPAGNLFYNEANWLAGCELRDWVFYPKK